MNGADSHKSTFRAEHPDQLLATQRPAVKVVLRRFAKIAGDVLDTTLPAPASANDIDRPHNVFCIDGSRGSGKTYTLLSLDYALHHLSAVRETGNVPVEWRHFFEEADSVGIPTLSSLKDSRSNLKTLAHVLRIIFPGDLVAGEALMEMIFAAMTQRLNAAPTRIDGSAPPQSASADDLKKQLRDQVQRGWYFARRFGLDAIIRDSIDYTDLVQRFDEESQKAAGRIQAWRDYVRRYLDYYNSAVLVVLLDDSDVQAELTHDILHSIRMFLNHPRIVTILAGNIRSMRTSLLHFAMQRIAPSITALEEGNRRTAVDWRQTERKTVEDYLEKILPPAHRLVLRQPELGRMSGSDNDFKKIAGRDLSSLCLLRTDVARPSFLSAKFGLAIKRELNESDVPSAPQARQTEEFLSWWVFANRYAAALAPRSARQIETFRDLFGEETDVRDSTATSPRFRTKKRLTVMLHDLPENYALIQRLGDQDASLVWWIRQQHTESIWVGQRMFRINGRDSFHRHYTYDYIRYRLDVGIAMPFRDNSEELIPSGLLPRLRGRRFMRRFFQPGQMPRQQRRYGVARWIDHAAVPGNCAYFYDLTALPDISLIAEESEREVALLQDGHWEASLAGRWIELIQDEQDELMLRYFTEVVCERLKGTHTVPSAALVLELNPLDIGRKYTAGVYEIFLRYEIGSLSAELDGNIWAAALARLEEGHVRPQADEGESPNDLIGADVENVKRMIALYAALVNDLRRAWHAIRIHEIFPGWMESGQAIGSSEEQQRISFAVIASQSHMPLYTRKHLEEKVFFGTSPWLRRVASAFSKEHLLKSIAGCKAQYEPEVWSKTNLQLDGIERLYTTHPLNIVKSTGDLTEASSGESAVQEVDDYRSWVRTLRHLGRAICSEWPYCDA